MPIDIATGDVKLARTDFILPGRVALAWTRHYGTALLGSSTGFGPGWTSSLFAGLRRIGKTWQFTSGEGDVYVFADPDEKIVKGETLRLFGAFLELVRVGSQLIVTRWTPDSSDITRFIFAADIESGGLLLTLVGIKDVSGDGLEVTWDASARVSEVRQTIERRTVRINYSPTARIESLVLETGGGRQVQLVGYQYDVHGRLSAAIDRSELANRYEYDAQRRLMREILRDGSVYTYKYDAKGRCTRFSGLDRYNEKRLQFFETARTTVLTNSYGSQSTHHYIPGGQVTLEVDAGGNEQRVEFDEHNRIVAKIDPTGATTRYSYDENGNRDSVTDPLGHTHHFTFNPHHQPLSITNPLGKVWRLEYDDNHRLIASANPLGAQWQVAYDDFGNRVSIRDPLGSIRHLRYRNGSLVEATDWMGRATRFAWDEFGRLIERVGAGGERTKFDYDPVGNPIEVQLADGGRLRASYDAGDNLVSFTSAQGHTTRYRYGSCRRLVERIDATGGIIRYEWGTEPQRLEHVINEKDERFTYTHDALGRVTRERSFDGREQAFEYDAAGRCTAFVNGNGGRIEIVRNAAGRIVGQTVPDGGTTTYQHDPSGRVTAAVNQDVAVGFQYDDAGRQIEESQGELWVRTEYNAVGEVVGIRTSLGHTVRYDLDPNGNVTLLVTDNDQSMMFERNEHGREILRRLPGGVRLDQRFDVMGRLVQQRVRRQLSVVTDVGGDRGYPDGRSRDAVSRDYRYDSEGLVAEVTDGRWGKTQFDYDPAERLLAALSDNRDSERFEYDQTGNIVRVDTLAASSADEKCRYGPGSCLLERDDTTYEYDSDGRLIRRAEMTKADEVRVWHYSWDAQGQLRSVRRPDAVQCDYKYDAFGRRVAKCLPDGVRHFLWNNNVLIQEWTEDSEPVAWIVNKGSFAPLGKVSKGSLFPIINDHLGTPREMLDLSGNVVWAVSPSAWGKSKRKHTSHPEHDCALRFQGQYYDEESGLHYNRFRYYDPETGRYINADPLRLRTGLNLYAYVAPPTQWVDPLGLAPQCLDVREEDVSGGPHAPDRTMNQVMGRAARSGEPQGQWGSREAAVRAAAQYDPARGGVQVVPIAPGDGHVVHHPVMSYPPQAGQPTAVHGGVPVSKGGPVVAPADHAIIIPKPDGLHTFPIDGTHPQHPSNQP